MRLGILSSHPIQYQAPWFRSLAKEVDLKVFFAHQVSAIEQGKAGFGVSFDWDVDLLSGYEHQFLKNVSSRPRVNHYFGCDTPEITTEIASEKFDAFIVTGWYLKAYWQAVSACRGSSIPILVRGDSQLGTPRSGLKKLLKASAFRLLLSRFDGFLFVGKRNREYLMHYGVADRKMFFAPHFVDNDWFAQRAHEAKEQVPEMRSEWGARKDTLVVLFVGKLINKKRPDDLLRALAILKHKGIDALSVFVGAGELETRLRVEANRLDVTAKFVGFRNQTELPRCYRSGDVLVLPSDGGETWGLVVNEGMACGVPAIVSDAVGCGPDLIENGKTGFSFPLGDAEALADRLTAIAQMKLAGHDFTPALTTKMRAYSLDAAVAGTLRAARELAELRN